MTWARLAGCLGVFGALVAGCVDDSNPSTFGSGSIADAGQDADGSGSDGGDDGSSCPILTSTLVVVVTDAVNGADVCDATVVATSGATSLSFDVQGTPGSCAYSALARPPAGTYAVDVTAPGYQPASMTGIVVTADACGTNAPTVTVPLTAAPADASASGG